MSDYTELKRLAEAAKNDCGDYVALNDYGMAVPPAVVLELIADLERNQRMLLAACMDMGAIGNALNADMNADGDELLGMVVELKAERDKLKAPSANAWRVIDRKGKRFTIYHQGLAEAIADLGLSVTPMCDVPPAGWECSRDKGHAGPCAASEVTP